MQLDYMRVFYVRKNTKIDKFHRNLLRGIHAAFIYCFYPRRF